MQVVVNSILTNYKIVGSGKTVVLLHGWGANSSNFDGLQQYLGKKFSVISVDLPGFGETSAPPNPWDLGDYASFLKAFLNKLDINNVYAYIGHSNGGAVLIKGLSAKILEAKKLVLLASAGVRNNDKTRKKLLNVAAKSARVILAPLPRTTKQKIRAKGYSAIGSEILLAEHMQDTFKRIVSEDVVDDAKRIKVPTLLVYGDEDKSTPVDYAKIFNLAITGSKLEIVEGAGHFVYLDAKERVEKLIMEFL